MLRFIGWLFPLVFLYWFIVGFITTYELWSWKYWFLVLLSVIICDPIAAALAKK